MKTVLVIEDEEATRLVMKELLESAGFNVITAKNGIEGIRRALSYHPDVMTIDLMMPHLDGLNMLKILTLLQLQIPSVLVTTREDAEKYVGVFPSVKNAFLKKRLKEDLVRIVREIESTPDRTYTDISYVLKENEIYGLLGKSDRKKILAVTDIETFDFVSVMLGDADIYEIYHAPDGQEGVIKAVMVKPDLILCDIDLPKINGITLAKILYILGHPFPIAFLSEKADVKTIQKASTLEGIQGYLLKHEVRNQENLLQQRIEQILDISDERKKELQASYHAAEIDKLGGLESGSSILASLMP